MPQKKTAPKSKSKTPSRSTKKAITNASATNEEIVTIDRRRAKERRQGDEATERKSPPAGPQVERRQKVNRRRQIDPTTCERDYTEQEVEFMNALDDYKRKSGRMFPTCSEVLEVIRSLGYVKATTNGTCQAAEEPITSEKPMSSFLPTWVGYESVAETGWGSV